jgi:hypothetical protein
MKRIIAIKFILFCTGICSAQVRDSVCIHKFTKDYWQSIRPIDSNSYTGYLSNSEYFQKCIINDSLKIKLKDNNFPPKTIFIGEFVSADSIHIIDFIEDSRPYIRVHFEGIFSKTISRNLLPQLKSITLYTNKDSVKFKLLSCDLYVQNDTGASTFNITGTQLPLEVQNFIMTTKENKYIIIDNVRIDGPDGKRSIEGITYQIKY